MNAHEPSRPGRIEVRTSPQVAPFIPAANVSHDAGSLPTHEILTADSRVIESLPEIQVPTLVLVGEQDKPFLAATDYMAAKTPAAEKVVLADAGHAANIQQPDAFNKAVRSFLERRLAR